MREINLIPDYEQMAKYFGHTLRTHGFEYGAKSPIYSFVEMIAFLATTDFDAVKRILEQFDDTDL
jgi:hypothetical protein